MHRCSCPQSSWQWPWMFQCKHKSLNNENKYIFLFSMDNIERGTWARKILKTRMLHETGAWQTKELNVVPLSDQTKLALFPAIIGNLRITWHNLAVNERQNFHSFQKRLCATLNYSLMDSRTCLTGCYIQCHRSHPKPIGTSVLYSCSPNSPSWQLHFKHCRWFHPFMPV